MITDNFQIYTSASMTTNLTSLPVNADQYGLVDIQAEWTGTPVGTLFIETSNDVGSTDTYGNTTGVTNWTTYTGSATAAGGAAGNFAWHIWATGFKWIRLSYTFGSSTGSLTARVNQKG